MSFITSQKKSNQIFSSLNANKKHREDARLKPPPNDTGIVPGECQLKVSTPPNNIEESVETQDFDFYKTEYTINNGANDKSDEARGV